MDRMEEYKALRDAPEELPPALEVIHYPIPLPKKWNVSSTTRRKRKRKTAIILFGERLLSWES